MLPDRLVIRNLSRSSVPTTPSLSDPRTCRKRKPGQRRHTRKLLWIGQGRSTGLVLVRSQVSLFGVYWVWLVGSFPFYVGVVLRSMFAPEQFIHARKCGGSSLIVLYRLDSLNRNTRNKPSWIAPLSLGVMSPNFHESEWSLRARVMVPIYFDRCLILSNTLDRRRMKRERTTIAYFLRLRWFLYLYSTVFWRHFPLAFIESLSILECYSGLDKSQQQEKEVGLLYTHVLLLLSSNVFKFLFRYYYYWQDLCELTHAIVDSWNLRMAPSLSEIKQGYLVDGGLLIGMQMKRCCSELSLRGILHGAFKPHAMQYNRETGLPLQYGVRSTGWECVWPSITV